VILDSVGIATESGNAQPKHLVFATNSGRYWLFYVDADATKVKTRWSTDLVAWTEGNALTLPMSNGGEGRDFAVAYRDFGGKDVVHVATSLVGPLKRIVWDTRATIAGDVITFGATALVHDLDQHSDGGYADAGELVLGGCDPDGNDVAIASDGHVFVATAWYSFEGDGTCDSNFARSNAVDDGTTWNGDAGFGVQHFTVPGIANARQIGAMTNGGLFAAWEEADNEPPSNVRWAFYSGGSWTPSVYYEAKWALFPDETPPTVQGTNDWSICRVDDTVLHAIRRKHAGDAGSGDDSVFQHYSFSGSAWVQRATVTPERGVQDTGVVLLRKGSNLLAAAIADDAPQSVRYATWTGGNSWSAWQTLVGADAGTTKRAFLSGTGCDDPAHAVLLWTEGNAPPYRVMGVPIAGLIP
jgi:hypothetical protein